MAPKPKAGDARGPSRETRKMVAGEPDRPDEEVRGATSKPDEDVPTGERRRPTAARLSTRAIAAARQRCAACGRTFTTSARFCPFDGADLSEGTAGDDERDPLLGKVVGERYEVERVLGHGGMGTVYLVRHVKLESRLAMKVLHPDLAEDDEVAPRLIAEARATAAIGHPNIVSATDFGEIDARLIPSLGKATLPYFVMEYLTGPSLADVLRAEGRLTKERTAAIALEIANALDAAHRAGIVHRDLKPDNIRLVPDPRAGGRDGITVKVLDFGVAKVLGASKKTQHGMVFGTPHYMSPEQGDGGGIDGRSDVYSLGIIVYECLAGELPFVAETFLGVLQQHLFEEPPPIEGALGSLPLEPIMQRCLQKNPDDRYPSMAAVAAAIQRASPAREAGLDSSGIRSRGHDEPTVITGDRAKRPKPYFALVAVGAIALTASVVAFRPTAPDTAAHSAKLSDLAPQLQAERREPAPAPPPPATSAPGPTSSAAPSAIPVVAPPPRQWQEAEEVDPPTAPTGVVDPWPY